MNEPAAQLLVVSPERAVLQAVLECARSLGHSSLTARTLPQAKRALVSSRVDMVCLDSVLPTRETERFWRWVTAASSDKVPHLVLFTASSAKVAPASLPPFFEPKRDGLVTKPIDNIEVARVLSRVLASRGRRTRQTDLLRAGLLTLDALGHRLYFSGGATVSLTPTEFRLVHYLIERAGELVGVDELLEEVWGYAPDTGGAEVVRSHVNNIRRKVRAEGEDPHVLRNVPYQGYGFLIPQEAASAS